MLLFFLLLHVIKVEKSNDVLLPCFAEKGPFSSALQGLDIRPLLCIRCRRLFLSLSLSLCVYTNPCLFVYVYITTVKSAVIMEKSPTDEIPSHPPPQKKKKKNDDYFLFLYLYFLSFISFFASLSSDTFPFCVGYEKRKSFFFSLSSVTLWKSRSLTLYLLLFLSLLHVIPFFIRLFVVFISSAMLFFCHEESTRLKLTPNFFVFFSFYCVCKCTNKRTQSVIDTDYKT